MKIAIGSDRRVYEYKKNLCIELEKIGHEVYDVGPYDAKYPVDYPIYGKKVGEKVASGESDRGIVICATGIGIMIACNKVKGIRCGMAYTDEVAKLMREHNDANVVAFGQSHMSFEEVIRRTNIFLETDFAGEYHCSRINQISAIEMGKEIEQSTFIDSSFNCEKGGA